MIYSEYPYEENVFAYMICAKTYDGHHVKHMSEVAFIGDIIEFKHLLCLSLNFNMLIYLYVNVSVWLFLSSDVKIMALKVSQEIENMKTVFISKQ